MITDLTDEKLAEFSDNDIAEFVRDYFGDYRTPSDEAVAYYVAALRMEPKLREDVFRVFKSAPLLCSECGKPSCLHGYPDD